MVAREQEGNHTNIYHYIGNPALRETELRVRHYDDANVGVQLLRAAINRGCPLSPRRRRGRAISLSGLD